MLAINIRALSKTYGNRFQALKAIDLTVEEGDFFALLGPNGAGKSTTIGIITSLVNKTSGSVEIFDADIDRDFNLAKTYLGVVPQEINFSQFETPIEIITNQAGYYGIPRKQSLEQAHRVLKQLELWDKRNEISRNLSGGMKRRLMIARALVHEPRLLILDEPTAGVDIEVRRSMWAFLERLNREGTTIVLTTHYLEEAEQLCRNIAIIDHGEIVENTTMKDLLATLHQEVFVLDTAEDLPKDLSGGPFQIKQIDKQCLEVVVEKGQGLNALFESLSQQGVKISSMRNRSNRLEELFIRLVNEVED
ncbi:MAG: ABC transporter ATP-binding protein [Gammaproteobacteria bacterium]